MQFKEAGIKTWMLTGDKGETAKMIGISCGLLSNSKEINLVKIDDDFDQIKATFSKLKDETKFELMISGRSLS